MRITGRGESIPNAGTDVSTVIDTVAVAVPPYPSEIVYVKESGPVYPGSGVYVHAVAVQVTEPCVGVE